MKKIVFIFMFLLLLFSCAFKDKDKKINTYQFYSKYAQEKYLALFEKKKKVESIEDMINWAKEIQELFYRNSTDRYLIQCFGELVVNEQNEEFRSFLYFFISDIYWQKGNKEVAVFYMIKAKRQFYSLEYNYKPIGYYIAKRIIKTDSTFSIKENMYNILLTDFWDIIDVPYTLYELSNLYKEELDIKKAIGVIQKIIRLYPYYTNVEGDVNTRKMRKEVAFYKSKKDWICRDLETLINNIKNAIKTKNRKLLYKYVSKSEFNTRIFQEVNQRRWSYNELQVYRRWNTRIIFEDKLEDFSCENEAYLKTTNWNLPHMRTGYF